MRRLEFWYDLASNYSYLSAMRIEEIGAQAGLAIVWRPFLLGPIFKTQGWTTSPFNLYPAKGRNMVRDMQRIAHDRNLKFVLPEPFPSRSLLAVRIAHALERSGETARFTKAAFTASLADGRDLGDASVLAGEQGQPQATRRGGASARLVRGSELRHGRRRVVLGR